MSYEKYYLYKTLYSDIGKMVMLPIYHCATVVLNARFNDIVKRDQLLTSKTVILGGDTSIFRIFAVYTTVVCLNGTVIF
jgi:hypothetical protein